MSLKDWEDVGLEEVQKDIYGGFLGFPNQDIYSLSILASHWIESFRSLPFSSFRSNPNTLVKSFFGHLKSLSAYWLPCVGFDRLLRQGEALCLKVLSSRIKLLGLSKQARAYLDAYKAVAHKELWQWYSSKVNK